MGGMTRIIDLILFHGNDIFNDIVIYICSYFEARQNGLYMINRL